MRLDHPDLQERLAAEYVLGTMTSRVRRRFEDYLERSPSLRAAVAKWENHLSPLAERLAPVEPPARVWKRIEARIGARAAQPVSRFWSRLGFSLGGAAIAAAATLFAVNLTRTAPAPVPESAPLLTAVLDDNDGARMVIDQPKPGLLVVRMVTPWTSSATASHELWVIPAKGAPRSLGVVNDAGETRIAQAELDHKLVDGAVFAVSVEPKGGSPTGAPTGQVVCKGSIARTSPTKPKGTI
jgi:anti-sigma-K factor RskA